MKDPSALPAGIQAKLYDMLLAAHKGEAKLSWLHGLVQRAGYVRYDGGQDSVLVTAKQLEKLLDLAPRTIRTLIRDGMPCARQGVGAMPSLFDARLVLEWVKQRGSGDWKSDGGKSSPYLEQFRAEQARAAKRKNDIAEKLVMSTDEMVMQMREGDLLLKQYLEAVGHAFGPDVAKAISSAYDEVDRIWEAKLEALKATHANGKASA